MQKNVRCFMHEKVLLKKPADKVAGGWISLEQAHTRQMQNAIPAVIDRPAFPNLRKSGYGFQAPR